MMASGEGPHGVGVADEGDSNVRTLVLTDLLLDTRTAHLFHVHSCNTNPRLGDPFEILCPSSGYS